MRVVEIEKNIDAIKCTVAKRYTMLENGMESLSWSLIVTPKSETSVNNGNWYDIG